MIRFKVEQEGNLISSSVQSGFIFCFFPKLLLVYYVVHSAFALFGAVGLREPYACVHCCLYCCTSFLIMFYAASLKEKRSAKKVSFLVFYK